MREQRWLVGNWYRLCWVRSCDWLDSTSAALFDGKDADSTFGNLLLGEEQITLLLAVSPPHSWFSVAARCVYMEATAASLLG